MTSQELAVPIRLELAASLEAALREEASTALEVRIEDEVAALLAELGLPGMPAVEITTGPATRPLRVVVHGTTVRYPMRLLLSAQPHFAVGPEPWSRSRDLMRSPAAWTSLIERRLEEAEPAEWAASFVCWLALTVIRLAPSCLVSEAQAAAYAGEGRADADSTDRAFARQVLAGLLDLGVGLRSRDAVLGVLTAGVTAAASPIQVIEQAFRRLRSYEIGLAAHPEYLGELIGSPVERAIASDELHDDVLRQQFEYVGDAFREDLGLPSPRFRLTPDPSVEPGWLGVQLHDQRRWPVRGLRPNDLLVTESARRVGQLGLETRAMQNPYTGEEGAEVPAASGPDLDAAGIPYWTAAHVHRHRDTPGTASAGRGADRPSRGGISAGPARARPPGPCRASDAAVHDNRADRCPSDAGARRCSDPRSANDSRAACPAGGRNRHRRRRLAW